MRKYLAATLLVALTLVLTAGCGNPKKEVQISGKATIDGTPIDLGIVQFCTETAEGGGNVQDGAYTASVPRGELTVRIRGYQYTGPMPEAPKVEEGAAPSAPPQRPRKPITSEKMWQNPTYKVTVEKPGVYDLEFQSEE